MDSKRLYSDLPSGNSIRLISLHPGADHEPLVCTLIVVDSYNSAPEYHALSYCWGDMSDVEHLVCNETSLQVTASLHSALRRLRQRTSPQLIWADAICINQKNVIERNQQVKIMRQIYLYASEVFIWIGHGDEHTASALKAAQAVGHACCKEIYGANLPSTAWLQALHQEPSRTEIARRASLVDVPSVSFAEYQPLWRFFQMAWFSRVWVIQEVRGTPHVRLLCGQDEIEWDFVAITADWISQIWQRDRTVHWKRDYIPSFIGFHNAFFMWDPCLTTRSEAPFPALLNRARRFRASDPRDKIFALLQQRVLQVSGPDEDGAVIRSYPTSPSPNELSPHLDFQVDYNMTRSEVFRTVVLDSIRCYGNLEVLSYAWQTPDINGLEPSWIPQWGTWGDTNYSSLLPFLYDASAGTSPQVEPSTDKRCLHLRGFRVGSVARTNTILRLEEGLEASSDDNVNSLLMDFSRIMVQDRWQASAGLEVLSERASERASRNASAHFANFAAFLLSLLTAHGKDAYVSLYSRWCNVCKRHISQHCQPSSDVEEKAYSCSICQTGDFDLCSACYDKGHRCEDNRHVLRLVSAPTFWCPYTDEIIQGLKAHAKTGDGDRFYDLARVACRSRMFFDTSLGMKGVGPESIEADDIVVVLFGSRVPFVLRRCGSRYLLIGDCYVHGIMDGEAYEVFKNGEILEEVFILV